MDIRSLEGQKRGTKFKREGSVKNNDHDFRGGSMPPGGGGGVTDSADNNQYPNRFRGASDYIQIQMEEFKAKYEVTGIIGRGGGGKLSILNNDSTKRLNTKS